MAIRMGPTVSRCTSRCGKATAIPASWNARWMAVRSSVMTVSRWSIESRKQRTDISSASCAEVLEDAERRRLSEGSRMRPHHVPEDPQRPLHVAAIGNADAYDDSRLRIGQGPVQEP